MNTLDSGSLTAASARGGDEIDLRELFASLARGKRWIIACVLVSTVAFVAAAFLMTPIYRASTVLSPVSNQGSNMFSQALGQLGGIASLAGINMPSEGSETEEALAVLRSREFTERFITERNLRPRIFASRWDESKKQWKDPKKEPSVAAAYRRFHNKIRSVGQDKKTGLVTLHIEWSDRTEAADWANDLISRLNDEMRARAITQADAALGFLDKESQGTSSVAVRDAVGRLTEGQVKQRMLANVTKEYAFRVVDRALPAEDGDFVKPQRIRLIAAGPVIGIIVGVVIVMLTSGLRRKPPLLNT